MADNHIIKCPIFLLYLDEESLYNCALVCKDWNIYFKNTAKVIKIKYLRDEVNSVNESGGYFIKEEKVKIKSRAELFVYFYIKKMPLSFELLRENLNEDIMEKFRTRADCSCTKDLSAIYKIYLVEYVTNNKKSGIMINVRDVLLYFCEKAAERSFSVLMGPAILENSILLRLPDDDFNYFCELIRDRVTFLNILAACRISMRDPFSINRLLSPVPANVRKSRKSGKIKIPPEATSIETKFEGGIYYDKYIDINECILEEYRIEDHLAAILPLCNYRQIYKLINIFLKNYMAEYSKECMRYVFKKKCGKIKTINYIFESLSSAIGEYYNDDAAIMLKVDLLEYFLSLIKLHKCKITLAYLKSDSFANNAFGGVIEKYADVFKKLNLNSKS